LRKGGLNETGGRLRVGLTEAGQARPNVVNLCGFPMNASGLSGAEAFPRTRSKARDYIPDWLLSRFLKTGCGLSRNQFKSYSGGVLLHCSDASASGGNVASLEFQFAERQTDIELQIKGTRLGYFIKRAIQILEIGTNIATPAGRSVQFRGADKRLRSVQLIVA